MSYLMRILTPKRVVLLVVTFLLLYTFWTLFLADDHHDKWYLEEAPCKMSEQLYEDMTELAFRIHETLDKLTVPHFLCYGTLWGALRMSSILPWDNNVNFCVQNEDVNQVDEAFLYKSFYRSDVSISYDARHGVYNLKYRTAVGDITVFQKFFDQMQRVGWEIRLFPFMYKYQHEFPPRLLEKPLPKKKFLGGNFPVPREEVELLKYLYPDDWWNVMKPKGC